MAIKPYVMRRELMPWPGLSAYPAQWRYGVYARGAVEPIAVFLDRANAEGFRDRKNGGKP